ncbi:MAG: UvrD-helicase domain-containing protein [Alphaproteobacteria bacterium]|nr:UvrD-helicase domain-containing protein [Alphaproteobacteria bacterium]
MLTANGPRLELALDALRLTDAQREALAIDRNVVLSAGAGSGKTHTLAWRYVRLLLEHANRGGDDLDAVVVLTFTEKAAEEMAERCHQRLATVAAAARDLDAAHPVSARLDRMLDHFEAARIGTFHGFCARILREFPAQAGLPGDLDVLEPVDAAVLRRASVERAVDAWIAREAPELMLLLDTFGSRRRLLEALDAALDRYGLLSDRLEAHAADAVGLGLDACAAQTTALAKWLEGTAMPTLKAIVQLAAPGATGFQRSLRAVVGPVPSDPLELHAQARAVFDAVLSGSGVRTLTHHTVIGKKSDWGDARRYAQAKQALEVLAERMADWPARAAEARFLPTRADARLLEALRPFAQLVREAAALHRSQLAERRSLDFDALQERAVDAVEASAELRDLLRQRHRWLMVDEFQDTDPRQWSMVRALGDPGPGEAADRVFLVGDVKQAIYGFRGGEVRLFLEAAAHLGVEPLELPDNFRSQESLITWFNQMFPRVLPEIWSPLAPVRPDTGGGVTWIVADDLPSQAAAAARWLASLPESPATTEPDVAILLRTRTHLGLWERVLREAGLPYRIARGIGFWARQEVLDVVNLVLAMVTGDPVATVGALRSPLLGVSDQGVQDHRLDGAHLHGLDRLHQIAWSRHDGPFADVLEDVLDALGAWRTWDADARANVQQLLARIRQWSDPLPVIADRLARRIRDVPQETEATPGASRARIVLLTVHASKGLEFPVVVLPELHRLPATRPDALSIARVDGAYVMAAGVDDVDAEVQTRATPGLLARVRTVLRADEDAEYRRLLYVAATRARDRLVLVGPPEASERSWAGLLRDVPASTEVLTADALPPADAGRAHGAEGWMPPTRRPALPPPPAEVSASDLHRWKACPARWFRTARLGLVEPGERPRARVVAGVRGEVLHGLLEDRVHTDTALALRRWDAAAGAAALSDEERASGARTLQRHLGMLADDADLARWLDAPGFDELGVRQPFEGGVFVGRIDRLVLDREAGGFLVVDWKTEHVDDDPEEAATAHHLQLAAYAWAANAVVAARGQPPVVGAVVYFTHRAEAVQIARDALPSGIPALLAEVAATRTLDEAWARAADHAPPCTTCAFFGRGCDGHVRGQLSLF